MVCDIQTTIFLKISLQEITKYLNLRLFNIRQLQVIDVPGYCHLVPVDDLVCNTWFIGVKHKTLILQFLPVQLVKC